MILPAAIRPVAVAADGKGYLSLMRRAGAIGARYGVGPRRMERRLTAVLDLVDRHGCGATLPVTVAAAERNPRVIARFATLGIEFAVHGYYHVDHAGLSKVDQVEQLGRARRLLEATGVPVVGFRAPYLRWNDATLHAARENGFLYESSEAMHWPLDPGVETDAYRRGLAFCGALPADDYPVLPRLDDGIVRIPYCLPDDESIVDRLRLTSVDRIGDVWLRMLSATHERGELFSLGVHPERIESCGASIEAVLQAARATRPSVWIARLEEIARWWCARADSSVSVDDLGPGSYRVRIRGPRDLTLLARDVQVRGAEPWADGYVRVRGVEFDLSADHRPVIGVHPSSPDSLAEFLREQGYVVEITASGATNSLLLKRERFLRADERPLLAELQAARVPVIRLGRWPDGARSALSITGDVDALTIWDYAFRFLGR